MQPTKKILGTKYMTYAEKRNFALDFPNYEVRRSIDLYVYLAAAHLRLKKRPNTNWINLHNDFGLDNCIGYHFWNAASVSQKPWVTTLELPCADDTRLKYLARKQCRKIFCLSSWVMNYEKSFLLNSPYGDEILPKLQLLHPSQEANIDEDSLLAKEFEVCRFIFIDRDFFRKGGYECVKAFTKVLESGFSAELIIVSKMDTKDYPLDAPDEELSHTLQLVEKSKGKIKIFNELSHQEVMQLIASSNVGLLPTYLDSYGYSVLEFFSYGLPAITTNINALIEINSSERGWIIDMPVVDTGHGVKRILRNSLEQRQQASNTLTDYLFQCLSSVLEQPNTIKDKSLAALKYVMENHIKSRNIEILEATYNNF
ncbi:glycosyltransferase [Rivularia sp. UHCC 0363]|uniref:glycosyltransferase n=1 Tax=Rivularia sp. UHCC 0363 TaxID=3110244 RepID=UPI002B219CEE|nr:glycosyltransferase [Rivularia sp. UHCC 0363]MEA5596123.1 glycosyltransferase [Rivularia sp. UHCC 0363]